MQNFPEVTLKAIPHKNHRYETCGDYFKKGKKWLIVCSKMRSEYVFLVLIHEFVEWFLTQLRGIKEKDITAFDIKFEEERKHHLHTNEDEPGDDVHSPYFNEHKFATKIEKLCCEELKIDWDEYEETILRLFE